MTRTARRRPGRGDHPLLALTVDIVAPIVIYYGLRGFGASVWVALIAGGVLPALGVPFKLITRRRVDAMGVLVVAGLAAGALLSMVSGSPRALLARDGLTTGAWACYMYASVFARRPATYVLSRPLLEGRRLYDPGTRSWFRSAGTSWDEIWNQTPRFGHIWRVCTCIWGSALLADAIGRIVMAYTLPISLLPALSGALWPVTFVILQVITNVYFVRAGFWDILRAASAGEPMPPLIDAPVAG